LAPLLRKGSYRGLLGIEIFGFILVDRIKIFFRVGIIIFIFSLYFLSYSFVFYYFFSYFTRIVVIAIFLVTIITFTAAVGTCIVRIINELFVIVDVFEEIIMFIYRVVDKGCWLYAEFLALAGGQFVNALYDVCWKR
jgi:hypothetical protein